MESQSPSRREALEALAETGRLNEQRLRRPRRYWIMFGAILAVFALIPYTAGWPSLLRFLAPPALMIAIAVIAAWKQPTAVRRIRLSPTMALQLAGFAVTAGILVGISSALHSTYGWWWLPLTGAALTFAFVAFGGKLMDRAWARRMSRRHG